MSELAQIGVTDDNNACLEILKNCGYFDEKQEAARFAASLAIRKRLFEGKNLANIGSNFRTQWNTSLVDPDYFFRNVIKYFDLCPSDYGVGLRSLIHLGLEYIHNQIKNSDTVLLGGLFND